MSWEQNNQEIRGWERGVREILNDIKEEVEERDPQTVEEYGEIIEEIRNTYLGDDE